MSRFSTRGVDTVERGSISQFINPGVQVLTITGLDEKVASTGKKQFSFNVETPKVEEVGFEAHEDSKIGGKIGRVGFTIYMDDTNESQVEELIKNVGIIADKLGVRDQVDAIEAASSENYLKAVLPLFRGKFAWWAVTGEEYLNKEEKVRTSLGLRRFGFIASMEEGETHLRPFDKENQYDYKHIAVPDENPKEEVSSDDFEAANELPWD